MAQQSERISSIQFAAKGEKLDLTRRRRIGESIIQTFLFLAGAISILTTLGIVYVLGTESIKFFTTTLWEDTNKALAAAVSETDTTFTFVTSGSELSVGDQFRLGESREIMEVVSLADDTMEVRRGVNDTTPEAHRANLTFLTSRQVTITEFLTGTNWNPQIGKFGLWALLNATLMTSLIAMIVALPIGLSVAIFLSEYASDRARSILKPILEVLAGVPTVVYGYFALTFMTPLLRSIFGMETVQIYNTASAGLVIGILIIPLVSSMSEDALHAVPRALRDAAYGLGATKLETAIKVVLPAAFSGIAAAFIVAISRAIGETMIVAIAAGAGSNFTFNPFEAAETMTGHIVRISSGDLSYQSIDYNSIFAIGLMLFVFTLSLNVISRRIVARYREVYD